MKQFLVVLSLLALVGAGCKKDTDSPSGNKTTATNDMNGNWSVKVWDQKTVASPWIAVYNATATSATTGTVHLDLTFDGNVHNIEDAAYTLSNNNTTVSFTKTGGNWTALSSVSSWNVIALTPTLFKISDNNNVLFMMATQ